MRAWHRIGTLALSSFVVLASLAAGSAQEQGRAPPSDPILRIETGRHSAPVTHLAVDGQQRYLATASVDKTARIWDLATGNLLTTLRVPIGPGPEGGLYTVALAPDAHLLFAAGYTGGTWDTTFSIYAFDVATGKLKTRLPGLPELVNDLAFAADGSAFAAVFSGRQGLQVRSATNGKPLGEDHDYGDIATSVVFDRQGRIATAAFDGFVRLYGPDYRLQRKAKMQAGQKLSSVAFSPDGRFLAVGYEDSLWVDVLNTADLKPAFHADTRGIEGGNLAFVGWAPEKGGYALVAGGTARDRTGYTMLRSWAKGGRGPFRDVAVGRDSINHVLGTGAGTLFATADPSWGEIDDAGQRRLLIDGQIADFRDVYQGDFALSADGQTIDYGLLQGGNQPYRFNLATRELTPNPPAASDMTKAQDRGQGIAVTDWRNGKEPRINGRPVTTLQPQEIVRSATVLAGGRALLGTDHHLRLFDGRGAELAQKALPATAWGVVGSGDGRVVAAALGDGTLRWYSLGDGELLKEQVAYFPSGDGQRWIAWTPEGFFAHSDNGGADLAGYQLNKGAREAPEWVEFAQLYQLYYAPELLAKKLAGTGEDEIRQRLGKLGSTGKVLNEHAGPVIELVDYCLASSGACQPIVANATRGFARVAGPAAAASAAAAPPVAFSAELPAGESEVKLHFRVTPRQGGVGDIDVFLNDRVVSNTRGFARVAQPDTTGGGGAPVAERALSLATGRNLVYVRAYDAGNGVETRSPAVEFKVAQAIVARSAVKKPVMYIVGAAVDRYPPPFGLNFAVKDMSDVVAAIKKNKSSAYSDVKALTLTDEQVTLPTLGKYLDELATEVTESDTVVIYLGGHGFVDDDAPNKPYYFITQNADPNELDKTALSQGYLKEKLTAIKSKNVFLFMDTCHSGRAFEQSNVDRVHNYFGQVYILAAASGDQQALDSYKGLNGPFAYAVIEGLDGKAARDAVVNDHDLGTFVKREVPRLVSEVSPGHQQTANFKMAGGEIEDFELTRVGH